MTYIIQMQYLPGWDIWVSQLNSNDPIYEFNDEEDALENAAELEASDPSGRKYRVITQ
jgi:hypothetical protein